MIGSTRVSFEKGWNERIIKRRMIPQIPIN